MSDYESNTNAESALLLLEALEKAIEKAREVRKTCSHVVHPYASGWTKCANCFAPVFVEKAGK